MVAGRAALAAVVTQAGRVPLDGLAGAEAVTGGALKGAVHRGAPDTEVHQERPGRRVSFGLRPRSLRGARATATPLGLALIGSASTVWTMFLCVKDRWGQPTTASSFFDNCLARGSRHERMLPPARLGALLWPVAGAVTR